MGNKSLDITSSLLRQTPPLGRPVTQFRKGKVRGMPCPDCQSDRRSIKIIRNFEIEGFPIAIWPSGEPFVEDGILKSDRFTKLIKKLGLGTKNLILNNPFNQNRLSNWIRKKSSMNVLNGAFVLPSVDIKNELKLQGDSSCYYAKLSEGIYFFSIIEEYLGNSSGVNCILFNNETEKGLYEPWDSIKIKEFLINFSKELYDVWVEENKSIGDPTAFDSVFLPDEIIKDLRQDFEDFLHSRDTYVEDLKMAYKRGYLLYGSPGNGKTLIIRTLCKYYGLEYFDIKRVIDNGGNLNMEAAIDGSIDTLLYPDEERPKVCVLEDIDKFTAFQGGDADNRDYGSISLHSLLRGLDGVDSFNDIILIATSNFPEILHDAITGRPGRFDKIYKIDKPTEENIQKLLNYYKLTFDGCDADFVSKSLLGSSMAFVAEFVKLAKMKYKRNNITVDEASQILEGIKKHQKLCEDHFKEEKIVGFKR